MAPPARRVRVEHSMGTAIGLDLRDLDVDESGVDAFFAWLRTVDARYSTYRADSVVSRVRRGELAVSETDTEFRDVLAACDDVRQLTDGAFDAWHHSPDGLDPSGLVKGWSIDRGALILEQAGARNFCVNAGGDVLARGEPAPGTPWRVGIRHPLVAARVAAVLGARDLAVATSGAYERGDHIRDPLSGVAPTGLLSFTILGPELGRADAYATAGFAMGDGALRWMGGLPGYEALAVTSDLRVVTTPGTERLRLS